MDFNNQNTTNFLLKVKKQAKRLFQLSKKQDSTLHIKSLSQAQEILANINGYPNWHSLEKKLTSNTITNQNINEISLEQYENTDLYYLKTKDNYTTFLRFNSLNCKLKEIENLIKNFSDTFGFNFNIGIHDLNVFFEQKNSSEIKNNNYNMLNVGNNLNLTEEQANKLFYIDNSDSRLPLTNELSIYLIVSSKEKYLNEHVYLCLDIINSLKQSVESIPFLSNQQFDIFNFEDGIIDKNINNTFFKSTTDFSDTVKKAIYLLNYSNSNKVEFTCKANIKNQEISFKFNNQEEYSDLINGIIQSISKTNSFASQDLNYQTKLSYKYLKYKPKTSNLNLKSNISNTLIDYNFLSSNRTSNVDLIYGPPGSGKSILNNILLLNFFLCNDLKHTKTAIIDIGNSYQGTTDLINNLLNNDDILIKTIKFNDTTDFINPLDLPLGKRIYTHEDIQRLSLIYEPLINGFRSFDLFTIQNYLTTLNSLPHKIYSKGLSKNLDKEIVKLKLDIDSNTTWWMIVDLLFLKGFDKLAKQAQVFATPLISDLTSYLSSKKELGDISEIFYAFSFIEGQNSFLSQPTNIVVDDYNLCVFDLDLLYTISQSKTKQSITTHLSMVILNLIQSNVFYTNNDYLIRDYPTNWNEDWKYYLNKFEISDIYNYYYTKKINQQQQKKLIIDEYHRFCGLKYFDQSLMQLARNSRKYNISLSIATQSLDLSNINSIAVFASGFFISKTNERLSLQDFGFNDNEIKTISNSNQFTWTIKFNTYHGKIFDNFKLDINPILSFAMSSLTADLNIKEQLKEKFSYFEILERSSKYLLNNKIKSFNYIENVDTTSILNDIIYNNIGT